LCPVARVRASHELGAAARYNEPHEWRPAEIRVCVAGARARRRDGSIREDVREFIRRLEAVGLTVESTPGHYRVLRDGKPLRKQNGMPFTLPFSPDMIRWRRSAVVELRKLGIDL
jgi:biotin operon repressor